jgi:hypothetical protein
MATMTIPVRVSPEAEARVAQLGVRRELEIMLEHTKEVVPGLRSITVSLEDRYDHGDEPVLLISAEVPGPGSVDDPTQRLWDRWVIETFPPEVLEHFCFMEVFGTDDDGR